MGVKKNSLYANQREAYTETKQRDKKKAPSGLEKEGKRQNDQ